MAKLLRYALYSILSILALLVILNIGFRGWEKYRSGLIHPEFAAAYPEVMSQPACERVTFKARQILENMSQSRYEHRTKVDEEKGLYELDCSGLVGFILGNVAPEQLRAIPTNWYAYRPQAECFQQVFAEAPEEGGKDGWVRVVSLLDARPGDFIAWSYRGHSIWENTGHIMMVLETPTLEENSIARVRVMDSSSGKHADDSRGSGQNGVGTGTMWFTLDKSGAPVAIHWWKKGEARANPDISIGRVVDTE
jgi:hypothetical protein